MNIYLGNQPINFIVLNHENFKTVKSSKLEYVNENTDNIKNDIHRLIEEFTNSERYDNIAYQVFDKIIKQLRIMDTYINELPKPTTEYKTYKRTCIIDKIKFTRLFIDCIYHEILNMNRHMSTPETSRELNRYMERFFKDYTNQYEKNMEVAPVYRFIKKLFDNGLRGYINAYDSAIVPNILNLLNYLIDSVNDL